MSSDTPRESFAALFEQSNKGGPARRGPRIGEMIEGVVVQVGRDAIFVDLDGRRQGFVESTDLRTPDGAMNVVVGDKLRLRVVQVDAELGIRLQPTVAAAVAAGASVSLGPAGVGVGVTPPSETAAVVKVAVGQVIGGTVDRVETYGLFIQIDGTKGRAGRGLAPTIELGVPRGTDLRKAFPIGTKLKAKVLELGDNKTRLSLRALKDDEERAQFDGFREKDKAVAQPTFGTFGDLMRRKGK